MPADVPNPARLWRRRLHIAFVVAVVATTCALIGTAPEVQAAIETYGDDFATYDYAGSTGTQPWASDWSEDEGDGPTAGAARVRDEPHCATNPCLVIGRGGPDLVTVERGVDLSGAAAAQITFDYKVHVHGVGEGEVQFRASGDGGGNWDTLATYDLSFDTATEVESISLNDYLTGNARIRFELVNGEDDSHLNVDNLLITADTTPPADIVFSEIDHRGDEFFELYNAGSVPVDINGYLVRLSDGVTNVTIDQGGGPVIMVPGAHYLVTTAGTGLDGVADQTMPDGLTSDTGFRVFDTFGRLLDTVGLGTSSHNEGGATLPSMPSGGITQSYERLNTGGLGNCTDTDDNRADFVHNFGFNNPQSMADPPVPCGSPVAADHVVISEFRPRGPNGVDDEFVEIFNPTGAAVDIGGWVFHITEPGLYRDYHTVPLGTTLEPGEHYLLSDEDGPTPADWQPWDVSTDYAPSWGDVVLKDEVGTIIDVLGYGSTSNGQLYETDALPSYDGGTADRSFVRRNGGYTDTDNNVDDFVYSFVATPEPGDLDPTDPPTFYTVAGGGGAGAGDDLATIVDPIDPDPSTNETSLGTGTGTSGIRAAAWQPSTSTLYAVEGGQLGTVDTATGVFTPRPSAIGNGDGSQGSILMDDIVALAFDTATGDLYAAQRRHFGSPAVLMMIDPSSGAIRGSMFGGDDYVRIEPSGLNYQVSGMAFDPTTDQAYVVHLSETFNTFSLSSLNPTNGDTVGIGAVPNDMRSLDFDSDGRAWATTATGSAPEQLHELDKTTGATLGSIDLDNGFDYEALAIPNTPPPNEAPVFAQDLLDRTDSEGTLISILASATDPNPSDALTYSAVGLPEGLSIDPTSGTIGGALGPNSAGTYAVTLSVTDDGTPNLSDVDTFTWTVTPGQVTYLVANTGGANGGNDLLTAVDLTDPDPGTNEVSIGTGTGTWNIEAIALQPGTNTLFAVEDDQLGTIDVTTGVFTPRPSIAGAGNGPAGLIAFDNIEGLSFDPFTGALYGTQRRGNWEEDLLFLLDPVTGAHVPAAFGGDDYVLIESQGIYYHSADIAFDPVDGQLYVVHWDIGGNWSLATLDPATGATVTLGVVPDDIASLAFDEAGRLFTSTDTGGTERVHELAKFDGSWLGGIDIDNGENYEAMAIAFPVDPNRPPVFNQDLQDRTDPEGATILLSAAATDPDGHGIGYTATGLPLGLSIDPGSGLISGTIDFAAAGTYPVEITVTDDGIPNLGATDTFTWTVSELNRPPVFDQDLLDRTDAEGAVISLSAAATDPDAGDSIVYGATGLPPGLSIDPGAGLISGTIGYTAAAASPYAVTITATDDGSPPESAVPDTFTWTVDNTNRPPSIVNPGPQTTPELAPFSIVITGSDPDGTTPSFTDSGTLPAWAVLTDNLDGTATIAGTPGGGDSGTTTVTVTASDGDLTDDAAFDLTVTNTNVAPTITNPNNQFGNEGSPFSVVLTASDPDGTTVSFTDSGTLPGWATLTDNGDDTATISGTPGYADAGATTVTITASDGDLSDDAVFFISIADTNRAPVVDPIADQSVAENDPFTLVVTASDPDGTIPALTASGLPGWASFVDNGDGTGTITGTPGFGDAAVSAVTITASDGSLPGSEAFALTVTEVNRPPTVDPVADQFVAEGAALVPIVVSASDPDGTIPSLAAIGLPAWASFVDNGDGTGTITGTPGYSDAGVSTVTIEAEDGGIPNLSASTSFDLTVTNVNRPPVVNPIADQSVAEGDPFSFTATASDPDGTIPSLSASGLPGWAVFVDHGDGTGAISGTPGYSDAAVSTITVTASDGPLSDSKQFDLTVTDTNRHPVFDTDLLDRADLEGTVVALSAAATDPDLDALTYSATGLPTGLSIEPGSGLISGIIAISAADGSPYAVEITVTDDGMPNKTATDTFFWTVTDVNQPPAFDHSLLDRTDPEHTVISLSAAASDPDNDILTYVATGLPPGLSIDPDSGLITGTIAATAAAASPYAVEITVTDSGIPTLADTDTFTWTITDVNRAPVLEWIPDQLGDEETLITFTASATDPDLDGVVYSISGAPAGAVIDPETGVFSWTPGEEHGVGSYAVTVTATDDGVIPMSHSKTVTINVAEVNQRPKIEPIDDQVSGEGQSVTLAVVVIDPDLPANDLEFSATGLPPGLSIEPATGVISGTVEGSTAGQYEVRVSVTDNAAPPLLAIAKFDWIVTDSNQPPELKPVSPIAGDEATLISFTAVATDPDGDNLSFSLTGAPPGASIDSSTGRFNWTPTEEQGPGFYSFTLMASDDGTPQLAASRTVTVDVREVNAAPTVTPLTDQSSIEGQPVVLVVQATDPDVPANGLTYAATGLPAGLQLDPVSGLIT
ncbi:MAG: putative Ig domain-containing protein, partial [Acidimicrobiia bacterium]|nr:putative Ig domain-containing protein [Acidimicrobiia bacterium]